MCTRELNNKKYILEITYKNTIDGIFMFGNDYILKCIPSIQTQNGSYIEVTAEEHSTNMYLICLTRMDHEVNSCRRDKPCIDVKFF